MKLSHSVIAISLALSAALVNAADESRELSLPLAGISSLDAEVGAGSFTLKASSTVDKVLVDAQINNGGNTEPELTLEKRGDTAFLVAKFPEGVSWFGDSPYIDITVTVPEHLNLALVDGSGDIRIEGLKGDIQVKDGSGAMEIIGGKAVSITDGSGNIQLSELTGELTISDGSGEIRISDIGGDTRIQDGSGDISATNIQGSIVINDGSGDIRVSKVSAMVEITDGSGDINVSDAESLKLHATGSGGVTSNNIRSGVSL